MNKTKTAKSNATPHGLNGACSTSKSNRTNPSLKGWKCSDLNSFGTKSPAGLRSLFGTRDYGYESSTGAVSLPPWLSQFADGAPDATPTTRGGGRSMGAKLAAALRSARPQWGTRIESTFSGISPAPLANLRHTVKRGSNAPVSSAK